MNGTPRLRQRPHAWWRGLTEGWGRREPHPLARSRHALPHLFEAAARELPRIRQLKRLFELTTKLLVRYMGTAYAAIFVEQVHPHTNDVGVGTSRYRLVASHGTGGAPKIPYIDADSLLIQRLLKSRKPLRWEDCQVTDGSDPHVRHHPYRRVRFILDNLNARLIVPCFHGRRLLGFLVLGERSRREGRYRDEELAAIAEVATSLAIALENARSYEELKSTTKKLQEAQDRLIRQERMVAAGKLAMSLAHEIKNPLAAIKTFTEFLQERYDEPAFRQEFCQVLRKEIDRINGIVQSLSDFARPLLLKMQTVDVQPLLKETLMLLSNDCLKRGIAMRQMFDANPIFISGDPSQLRQAFFNLCVNAIQAMDPHTKDVGVGVEHGGTLAVTCHYHESQAIIRVMDSGAGIPKEHLALLFEPFFTTKEGGMGLGLAVVKQIVEQHDGSTHVESQPGTGTTFEIRLPWAMQRREDTPPTRAMDAAGTDQESFTPIPIDLLVVDDEPKICSLLKEVFERRGCRVRAALSGEQALEFAEQKLPQLVILDLRLEELNGFEVLQHLKGRYPDVEVIVITGTYSQEDIEGLVKGLGALACFAKPLDMSALQRQVFETAVRISTKAHGRST